MKVQKPLVGVVRRVEGLRGRNCDLFCPHRMICLANHVRRKCRTSSPKGEDSASGVLWPKGLLLLYNGQCKVPPL